jgi:outer membrane biosynthesis protein TonB
MIDDQGVPRNGEILWPIGAGLDEEAVRTVSTWKFKAAERAGRPVAPKIAVEADFTFTDEGNWNPAIC